MPTSAFDLSGKVAIVTGGNGGIGLGMARGLAEAGAGVAIIGRNEAKSNAAVADSPIGTDQSHRAVGLQKVEVYRRGMRGGSASVPVDIREKERNRHVEHLGNPEQPAGGDAVRAPLVFLNLLERDAESVAQLGLAQSALQPQSAHTFGDLGVDRIAAALSHQILRDIPEFDPWPPMPHRHRSPAASQPRVRGVANKRRNLRRSSGTQGLHASLAGLSEIHHRQNSGVA